MSPSPMDANPDQVRALDQRSRVVCVTYRDHPMPGGATPARARIGVETTGNTTTLLVDRGLAYHGHDEEVAQWLRTGSRSFSRIEDALDWLRVKLNRDSVHPGNAARRPPTPQFSNLPHPASVTDVEAVNVPAPTQPGVDEEELAAHLASEVFGQERSLESVARVVATHTSKPHPRKPVSVMLIGPTGVGKTQTAIQLTHGLSTLSDQTWGHLRLDMAEFHERHTVARLVGAPPGYIGYGEDTLATRLAEDPHQVILFDEIEKAHPAVLTALMGLLDSGRLDSTRQGSVTASQSVLLFTSNLGGGSLPDTTDLTADEADSTGRSHLLHHGLAPELVGRFGRICLYTPLPSAVLAPVAARAVQRVATDYGCTVSRIEPDYLSGLLTRTHGSPLGVRALEYLVESDLGLALSAVPNTTVEVHAATAPLHARLCAAPFADRP